MPYRNLIAMQMAVRFSKKCSFTLDVVAPIWTSSCHNDQAELLMTWMVLLL